MAYTVDRTQAFEDDFDESLDYLANELKSPQAAMTLIDEVEYALHVLEKSPFLYAVSRKPFLSAYGYREYHVKKYVMVYRVDDNVVSLLRFFHQTQLYERFVMDWE